MNRFLGTAMSKLDELKVVLYMRSSLFKSPTWKILMCISVLHTEPEPR